MPLKDRGWQGLKFSIEVLKFIPSFLTLVIIMLNIISEKMKTIFEGQLTILPVSLVPQVAHMDETVVRVFRGPLKSQQCHFGEQSDPGVLL